MATIRIERATVHFTVLAALLALAGCGGGGGGTGQSQTNCIPTHSGVCRSPDDFESFVEPIADSYREEPNFRNQWGLDDIGAHWAYAHLEALKGRAAEPGSGVTIGFVDTGIDQGHPMFAGKRISEERLAGATDETVLQFRADPDRSFSHGTAVASIAAGRPSGLRGAPQGVAWAADVAMFAIPLGTGGGDYVPVSIGRGTPDRDIFWADLFRYVLGRRGDIDILNLSFNINGIVDDYSEQELREGLGRTIAALAQRGAADKTILVWAAGNAHGDPCDPGVVGRHCVNNRVNAVSVEVLAGLAARIPELRGHTVVAVALKDGLSGPVIADFSNRCGIAARYCIAAPGDDVRFAYFGDEGRRIGVGGGTSFAAPMVAGGLAIMKQLFRDQLSNTELVERLLVTANNTGRYANRAVYGRGMMDLKAATSPVGVLNVPAGSRVEEPGSALQRTAIRTGAAIGDGLEQTFVGREIVALDALDAPFWFELGDLAATTESRSTSERLRELMAPSPGEQGVPSDATGHAFGESRAGLRDSPARWRLGFLRSQAGAGDGHLALAERALAFSLSDGGALSGTAFTTGGEFDRAPASGATVSLRPTGSPLGLHAGWVGERETMLGSAADGAFGTLAADAVFAGIRAHADLGGWRMSAGAEIGTVDPATRDGLMTDISPLTTSAFALQASRTLDDDGTLRLSVSQPLRVEHGRATVSLPIGRTKSREIVRSAFAAELAPSGRQVDVAAQWARPMAAGELRAGAVVSRQPGHRKSEGPELTLLTGWRFDF